MPAAAISLTPGSVGGGEIIDPRVVKWLDVSDDATRTTFSAKLPCCLPPTAPGRRQYLLLEAYVEVRAGWVRELVI